MVLSFFYIKKRRRRKKEKEFIFPHSQGPIILQIPKPTDSKKVKGKSLTNDQNITALA